MTLKCSLSVGYVMLNKFPTFMIFSNNLIAGCDLASPGPPDLEHIWGPKWQPVYRLFYITIIGNFYGIQVILDKPHRRMRFGIPMASKFGAYFGSQMAACVWIIGNHKKNEISFKNPCDFLIVSLLSSWRCLIPTLVVQCRCCMQVMVL